MENFIITVIVIAIVAIGVYATIKRFKSKSSCCGGGGYRPRKKRLSKIILRKTFVVSGMHCENCKIRVEEIVNDIKGVAGKVDLKKGELTVSYAEPVEDMLVKSRIERAGYTVEEIK